jgi:hypothetical protein
VGGELRWAFLINDVYGGDKQSGGRVEEKNKLIASSQSARLIEIPRFWEGG